MENLLEPCGSLGFYQGSIGVLSGFYQGSIRVLSGFYHDLTGSSKLVNGP